MGHVGTLGRGVGGGAQESRGSDGNSVVTEREGEGEDGRATADGPGSRGAARDRDTDMDIDGEVNGDGDEQEGGEAGTEREDAEVEDGEGEGEQDMGGEVEAEVEADGEEEGEGDGEEDTTGPDGGTGAEDQGAQSNRHDNKGQQVGRRRDARGVEGRWGCEAVCDPCPSGHRGPRMTVDRRMHLDHIPCVV